MRGTPVTSDDVDIVIFDKDINIEMTIINGKIIYSRHNDNNNGL